VKQKIYKKGVYNMENSQLSIGIAYSLIEDYYERLKRNSSTSGRKYNYNKIKDVMERCPEICRYWDTDDNANFYVDRVIHLRYWIEPKRVQHPIDYISCPACAYIVELEDYCLIKVGKAKNFNSRVSQLSRQYGKINPITNYYFDNEEDAYMMEVLLHKYFKEKYPNSSFIPQDRFEYIEITEEDQDNLTKIAQKIRNEIWF
jgi:hypothetical protein